MTQFIFLEIILLIPDFNHTQHSTLSFSMVYNNRHHDHVIIGDQSQKIFLTLSEASPQHRRCFAEQLGNIGERRRWITKPSNYRRYYHIEYASPMFTRASPMCRRCVLGIFNLGVRPTLPNVHRLLGAVRRYIADGIWRRNIGRKFSMA